ncbi:Gfo/Idh/MocA family oxidoreductase [Actinomycetospora sp. OC33-EN08]|uniref:Gfo/Idh/MocA family oxidoreductase n=1 Tax=Actinomycetospora aurantiaca TaxID=3129233 RepID=A0ABU8MZ17_9PSEU
MSGALRVAVLGVGFIGTVHAHAVLASGAHLVAVAASDPGRGADAARRLGADRAGDAEEIVVADDVDVVHVCTPDALHVPLARRALAAGKAVVCEKPLATTLDDARALLDEAGDAVTAVPFVYRFHPMVREARARVTRGDAGALHLLHGGYLQDWQAAGDPGWRGAGDATRAFADVGIHWCDLAEFVSSHRITRLLARLAADGASTTVLFETDHGATGSTTVSQTAIGRRNQLRISVDGARASYGFDQEEPETLAVRGVDGTVVLPRGSASMDPSAARYSRLPPGHPQGYQDCFDAFVSDVYAAVRGERPDGLPSFADGVRAAALTDAVGRSIAAGATWVEVPT